MPTQEARGVEPQVPAHEVMVYPLTKNLGGPMGNDNCGQRQFTAPKMGMARRQVGRGQAAVAADLRFEFMNSTTASVLEFTPILRYMRLEWL